MFSRTLSVTDDTDAETVARSLRADGERLGLPPAAVDEMMGQVEPLLRMVIANGRAVASTGGHFQAAKDITGGSFCVKIKAQFGPKRRGFFSSLFGLKGN